MSTVQVAPATPRERRSSHAFRHRPRHIFPDYALPDHTGTVRTLSELQGDDPLILTLARGHYCPKEHKQHLELAAFQPKIANRVDHGDALRPRRSVTEDTPVGHLTVSNAVSGCARVVRQDLPASFL